MTLHAAGAYIQRLREEAKISRHALSKRVNTSDSQIIRIEQGRETRASLLFMIMKEVNANPEDVMLLLLSPSSTIEDGVMRAERWIEVRKKATETEKAIHPDVFNVASRLTEYELGRWVALGERIIEERTKER